MRDIGIEEVSSEKVWKFGMIMVRKEKESNHMIKRGNGKA